MDFKWLISLVFATMVVASLAGPIERGKRQVSKDPSCFHPLYPMLCADNSSCIKESQVCDDVKSCPDNSDEENCGDDGNGVTEGDDNTAGEMPENVIAGGGDEGDQATGDGDEGDQATGGGDDNSGSITNGSCTNPTGGASRNTGLDDLRQQMLNSHNFYRCLHGLSGVGQMTLSDELNNYAQEWADQLAAKDTSFHSTNRGITPPYRGENIWTGSDYARWTEYEQFTGEVPVSDWYSELNQYGFQSYTDKGMVGHHFTQVAGKLSMELGCGVSQVESTLGPTFYVVCQYL